MDNSSVGAGFMAVFAVSGGVALLAHRIHKRLVSEFMKKFEFELGGSSKDLPKKKVRFADDSVEQLPDENVHWVENGCLRPIIGSLKDEREFETMPLNRQALYRGIIESNALKGHHL